MAWIESVILSVLPGLTHKTEIGTKSKCNSNLMNIRASLVGSDRVNNKKVNFINKLSDKTPILLSKLVGSSPNIEWHG